ncbi:MAG: class I SAM-dependent methyltransferase [Flavobacteriaceae bacterium]|nr:class I SAM-dependent methyltransferase [Flavobacteriaceae bacterium]
MIKILKSPINNAVLKPYLKCIDYTVSGEEFSVLIDESSELLVTSPRPKNESLGAYYKSENYISHTDSQQSFFDKIYQFVKRYSLAKKVKLINGYLDSNSVKKTVLDIGCGTGDFLLACQESDYNIFGVEPNEKAKSLAENKLNSLSVRAQSRTNSQTKNIFSSIEELDSNQQFDCITLWHVLEHVSNLEEYIFILKKKLKPNGTLIIAVPNYKSFDAKYYGKFWAAFDLPRHLWHFSKKSISLLFEKEKMKVTKTIPMKFDSFYVSLLSEKYKTGKSNPLKAFFIGLKSNIKAKRTKEYSSLIYIIQNS